MTAATARSRGNMANINFLLHAPIAHRGLHGDKCPENSLQAFQKAVNGGFPIELDLHLIKSGEVVVFHDDNLKRLCGYDKAISRCTFTEIRELFLDRTRERIPLLTEVLSIVDGKVPLLIELKSDAPAGKLEAATVNILKNYKGKYAIQSFNPLTLRWFKKHAPEIPRGLLAGSAKDKKGLGCHIRTSLAKPDFISFDIHALPNQRVEKLRESGLPVIGWTAKNLADSKDALNHCDNLVCENFI